MTLNIEFFYFMKKGNLFVFRFFSFHLAQLSWNRNVIPNHKSQITIDDLLLTMMSKNISIVEIHAIFK